jgi:hypothetical protein
MRPCTNKMRASCSQVLSGMMHSKDLSAGYVARHWTTTLFLCILSQRKYCKRVRLLHKPQSCCSQHTPSSHGLQSQLDLELGEMGTGFSRKRHAADAATNETRQAEPQHGDGVMVPSKHDSDVGVIRPRSLHSIAVATWLLISSLPADYLFRIFLYLFHGQMHNKMLPHFSVLVSWSNAQQDALPGLQWTRLEVVRSWQTHHP